MKIKSACSTKGTVKWTKKHPTVLEKIFSQLVIPQKISESYIKESKLQQEWIF